MAVGEPRTFIEMAAGEPTQPVEMRLDMTKQRVGEMDPQQVRQCRIGAVKVHARGVGREQAGLTRLRRHILLERLVHL
jgi:hypothetical protein